MNRTLICMFIVFMNFVCLSQTPISFQAALDSALTNNLTLKNEKLKAEYQKKLIAGSYALPQTMVQVDYGRLNSYYFDNRVGISQNLEFPTVYKNQKRVLTDEWNKSEINVALKSGELKKQVAQVFYLLVNLEEKKQMLLEIDSIYSSYLEHTLLRLKVGEGNILEKSTIENQRLQIAHQLDQLNTDMEIEGLHFQLLLNTTNAYLPSVPEVKMTLNGQVDKTAVLKHPSLQMLEADVTLALSTIQLEESKLHPSLLLAVNSGTMYGTGSNNLDYTYSTRFNSAQFGVGIPLFTKQRQHIDAAKINAQIASNNLIIESQLLETQFMIAFKQYEVQKLIVQELEEIALPNGKQIFETAQKQFLNGDISYLEWAMLVNQSIEIQSNYQDAVLSFNQKCIELIYFINQ